MYPLAVVPCLRNLSRNAFCDLVTRTSILTIRTVPTPFLMFSYHDNIIYNYMSNYIVDDLACYQVGCRPMARKKEGPERKMYGLRLDQALVRELQHLAVDEDRWMNDLVEEGIRDLLKKCREKRKEQR